mgnify:CR=1 FL=1|jgi:hypothetical protein
MVEQRQLEFDCGMRNRESSDEDALDENNVMLVLIIGTVIYTAVVWSM